MSVLHEIFPTEITIILALYGGSCTPESTNEFVMWLECGYTKHFSILFILLWTEGFDSNYQKINIQYVQETYPHEHKRQLWHQLSLGNKTVMLKDFE